MSPIATLKIKFHDGSQWDYELGQDDRDIMAEELGALRTEERWLYFNHTAGFGSIDLNLVTAVEVRS